MLPTPRRAQRRSGGGGRSPRMGAGELVNAKAHFGVPFFSSFFGCRLVCLRFLFLLFLRGLEQMEGRFGF